MASCAWLLSLSRQFSRFIQAVLRICTSFLFLSEKYSKVWIHIFYFFFTHLPVDGHLRCFQFGATMKSTAVDMPVQVLGWIGELSVLSGVHPGVRLLARRVTLAQRGRTTSQSNRPLEFRLSTSLSTCVIICLFYDSHPRGRGSSTPGRDGHFPVGACGC